MASQAYSALGVQLSIGTGASPYTYVDVLEASTLKGPAEKMDSIEVTSLDSQGYKEYITGLRDSGTLTFDMNYTTPGTGAGVSARTLRSYTTITPFKITLPKSPTQTTAGDSYTFNGWVTEYSPSFDQTKQISASITIQVTGAVNYVAGS